MWLNRLATLRKVVWPLKPAFPATKMAKTCPLGGRTAELRPGARILRRRFGRTGLLQDGVAKAPWVALSAPC